MSFFNQTTMVAVFAPLAFVFCGFASADFATFDDVPAGNIPATPFVSGGLLFESEFIENAVFPPDVLPGANNGTQAFGWCGSNCGGGETQIITVSHAEGGLFDLTSIDAGNLLPGGFGVGEWAPGMTIELLGNFENGGTVAQSLAIQENVFETFQVAGFTGLTSLEILAPPVLKEGPGQGARPDGLIDNLVWNPTAAVPEPGTAVVATLTLLGFTLRRRRRSIKRYE